MRSLLSGGEFIIPEANCLNRKKVFQYQGRRMMITGPLLFSLQDQQKSHEISNF